MGHTGKLFNIIQRYDKDKKGTLTDSEMIDMFRGYKIPVKLDDIHNAKKELGIELAFHITLSDLANILKSNTVHKILNRNIIKIFTALDFDKDGIMSKKDFSRMREQYTMKCDMKDILNEYFKDKDHLTMKDFIRLMGQID